MNGKYVISSELTLQEKYTNEIKDFWLQGTFSKFKGLDNKRINFATFTSPEHKKDIVIVQGRSESYLKYKETIFDLFHQGYNVFIHDHRGQGLSERILSNPYKGYVNNFDDYVHDLNLFINCHVLPLCHQKKPYLLAHSMGGAISSLYLEKHANVIASSIFLAPMFGINTGKIPVPIAKKIIQLTYKFEQLFLKDFHYFFGQGNHRTRDFKGNSLTHSPVRYEVYKELYLNEKAIQLGGVTTHWLKEGHRIIDKILIKIEAITTPILVLQAGGDTVVDNNAQQIFYANLPTTDKNSGNKSKEMVVINDAKHELLFEQDKYRNQVIEHILKWFQ